MAKAAAQGIFAATFLIALMYGSFIYIGVKGGIPLGYIQAQFTWNIFVFCSVTSTLAGVASCFLKGKSL